MSRFGLLLSACIASLSFSLGHEQLSLGVAKPGPEIKLEIRGKVGTQIRLEASPNPANQSLWQTVDNVSLTSAIQNWSDPLSATLPKRFYRALAINSPVDPQWADNFILLDETGRAYQLYYHGTNSAIVLVFSSANCPEFSATVAQVNGLKAQFASRGVTFWMVDGTLGLKRDDLAAKASAAKSTFPILQDRAGVVTSEYGATFQGEVVAINTTDWSRFYQGVIEQKTAGGTRPWLAEALNAQLQGQPVPASHTHAESCSVETAPTIPNYTTQIAPLLIKSCVRCHSPGNIGNWEMSSHARVLEYASSIKSELLQGTMPPWHADPEHGKFANDVSLSTAEVKMLADWLDAGAPKGTGADPLLAAAVPAEDYPLGKPDVILKIPQQSIPADGVLPYRYVNIPTTFPTDVWLKGAVIKPGNRKVLHHCLVYFGGTSGLQGLDGFFAGYVPGYDPVFYPEGTGKLLPKGTTLRFQLHYTTTGEAATDQTEIGLYLAPTPPKMALQTRSAFNLFFNIPPGAADHEVAAQYQFSKRVLLYELSPHMHLRGSRFRYEAWYPDGRRETILSVPFYDFDWQTLYRFAQPKELPAGTLLRCIGAFNNSAQNPYNPNPNSNVTFGDQTFHEMFIGYFNFVELP